MLNRFSRTLGVVVRRVGRARPTPSGRLQAEPLFVQEVRENLVAAGAGPDEAKSELKRV